MDSQERDARALLGIAGVITEDSLRQSYRTRVQQWHPDRLESMAPELKVFATSKLAEINAAHDILKQRLLEQTLADFDPQHQRDTHASASSAREHSAQPTPREPDAQDVAREADWSVAPVSTLTRVLRVILRTIWRFTKILVAAAAGLVILLLIVLALCSALMEYWEVKNRRTKRDLFALLREEQIISRLQGFTQLPRSVLRGMIGAISAVTLMLAVFSQAATAFVLAHPTFTFTLAILTLLAVIGTVLWKEWVCEFVLGSDHHVPNATSWKLGLLPVGVSILLIGFFLLRPPSKTALDGVSDSEAQITRESPPLDVSLGRKSQGASEFPAFVMHSGKLDADGEPKTNAELCLRSNSSNCFVLSSYENDGVTFAFGLQPRAERIFPPAGGSLAFFSGTFSGGGSGTLDSLALLRLTSSGSIENLLPKVFLTNQSDRRLWNLPTISTMPILATADFIWGKDETHFDNHFYTISAYSYNDQTNKYSLKVNYPTSKKYAGLDAGEHVNVLREEKFEIVRRLSGSGEAATETVRETDSAADPIPSADDAPNADPELTSEIKSTIDQLRRAILSNDPARIAECYSTNIKRFYLKDNVSRNFVLATWTNQINQHDLATSIEFTTPEVRSKSHSSAYATVQEHYVGTKGSEPVAWTVETVFGFSKDSGLWKIDFERQFNVRNETP